MRNGDEKIIGIKANLYDIVSKNEAILSNIEKNLVIETDPERIGILSELWEKYNTALKSAIANSNLFFECVFAMKNYSNDFGRFITSTRKGVYPQQVINNKEVDKEEKSTDVIPVSLDETSVEEDSVESVAAPSTETPVEEAPAESVAAPSTETPVEEAPAESVAAPSTETPVEEAPAESVAAPSTEIPVEEAPAESVAAPSTETPVEEAESVAALSTETPVEETPTESVAAPSTETPVEEAPKESVAAPLETKPLIPTIEIEKSNGGANNLGNASTQLIQLDDTKVVENPKSTVDYIKMSANPAKAILINNSQAVKLRSSLVNQKTLFLDEGDNLENVSEAELEKMINEVPKLYDAGKIEEANNLSERISVLSKKMQTNGAIAA